MDAQTRYELLENIGTGSFATVYRARDNELQREVAIRQIHPQYLDDPRFLDRYWAEAQLLASVQHPHIVTIYDIVRSRGWLVLELMQTNLRDRLSGRPMDLRALRTTLIHALKALKYLHSRGIIHGDINPANLMVDHRKRVKVGDFGIARRVARTDGSVSKGTSKYMAPEALSGDITQVGPASDLYSLGFSCYELMCGSSFSDLFPGLNLEGGNAQAAWMMWHAASDRKLPSIGEVLEGVPPDLASVIERMVEKKSSERFQSADEVLAQLGDESRTVDRDTAATDSNANNIPTTSSPRGWIVAMFLVSTLVSLALLFIPTSPTKPQAAPPTKHAIVRLADLEHHKLEIEDRLTGIPEEVTLPAKPRIKLVRQGENDQFILPRDIAPGDWIEIHPAASPDDAPTFVILRPIVHHGEIRQLDITARRMTVSLISGRLKDELVMTLPERTPIRVNGGASKLNDLRIGDRVEVEHLLDPTGALGELVSRVEVSRSREVTGYIVGIDPAKRTLTIAEEFGAQHGEEFPLATDATFKLNDDTPLSLEGIRPQDRITLQVDSLIRSAVIARGDLTESGVLLESRVDGTILVGADSGNELLLNLPATTDIRLGQELITRDEIWIKYDRLTVTIENNANGERTAKAIHVTRTPKHNRWAMVIGNGTFEDAAFSPLPHVVIDAQAIQRTLVNRYAVNPMWCSLLVDQNVAVTRSELARFLPQVTESMQLIVVILGHAEKSKVGGAWIASKDSRLADISATGLSLDALVETLERCPAKEKTLLLDLTPTSDRSDSMTSLDLPQLLSQLKTPLKTVQIIGASSEGELSHTIDDGKRSWFGLHVERAFSGAADTDHNSKITADELMKYLEPAAFLSDPPSLQHPFLWTKNE